MSAATPRRLAQRLGWTKASDGRGGDWEACGGAAKFNLEKLVGRGSYGQVCAATQISDGKPVAVKRVVGAFDSRRDALCIIREVRILAALPRHDNIVNLLDVRTPLEDPSDDADVFLIFEKAATDLEKVVASNQYFTGDHIRWLSLDLLRGLRWLHSAGVVHRDLKPANVLVDRAGHVALCDFGIAAACSETMKTPHKKKGAKTPATPRRRSFCGTIDYMAPELLRGEPYDDGVDWWALGCVFHELLSGKPPFSRDRPRDMFCAILREEPPSLIVKCGVECNDAVQGLLKKSSGERFNGDALRSHAFFGDVDWSKMERKEVAPPHVPVLKPYLVETPAGVRCVEMGKLPRLNDDGESSDEDDSSSARRAGTAPRRVQDAFSGFAYAGDD
mmetsp:Transcript_27567/g.71373  ORF Transcript_27567/g.71373 Transcript_27567/m.71373 type:complete len:389 (+) Transcript_27567:195-1361(+)